MTLEFSTKQKTLTVTVIESSPMETRYHGLTLVTLTHGKQMIANERDFLFLEKDATCYPLKDIPHEMKERFLH